MSRDDDPNNDLQRPSDDDPDNELHLAAWVRGFVWVLVVIAFVLLALRFCSVAVKAQDRGYLPPPREVQRPYVAPAEEDPLEYYAEDWVVLDQDKRTVCRDPYIMRDIKIIKCVGRDPVR